LHFNDFWRHLKVVGAHSLELTFNDGIHKRVNLRKELYGEVFEPLLDPQEFAKARLEGWTVAWPGANHDGPLAHQRQPKVALSIFPRRIRCGHAYPIITDPQYAIALSNPIGLLELMFIMLESQTVFVVEE
jgi:hypothetical protein